MTAHHIRHAGGLTRRIQQPHDGMDRKYERYPETHTDLSPYVFFLTH